MELITEDSGLLLGSGADRKYFVRHQHIYVKTVLVVAWIILHIEHYRRSLFISLDKKITGTIFL